MELQEQKNTLVDPTEFDNIPVQKEDEKENKDISLNEQGQDEKDNRGADLAVPPESDAKDPTKEFVADEASVTKPIYRPVSTKYRDEKNVIAPNVANIPRVDFASGIVTDKGVRAGIYGTEMKTEAEISLAELNQPFTIDKLTDIINTNKPAPPEMSEDAFAKAKRAVYFLNNRNQFPNLVSESQTLLQKSVELVNNVRKNQTVPTPFTRDNKFAPTKKAIEEMMNDEFDLYDKQRLYFESRKQFYPLVQTIGDNISAYTKSDKNIVHEILMKRITTGEFFDNLTQTGSEIVNPFIVDMPPFMLTLLKDGAIALYDGVTDNTRDFFDAVQSSWNSREANREKFKQAYKDLIFGSDPVLLSDFINDAIHEELESQLASGKINRDQYNRIATFEEEGRRIKRKIVSEEQAQLMLNESLQQLTTLQSFLLLSGENVAGAYGITKIKARGAKKEVRNLKMTVDKFKLEQAAQGNFKYAGMSTIQAARAMRADLKIFPKFNEDKFKLGLRLLENENQFSKMIKDYSKKREQLKYVKKYLERKGINPDTNVNFVKREKEVQSLKGKIFRNTIMRRTKPIFKDTLDIALPVSLTQLVATEVFAEKFDWMDYYTAQGVGSLIHMAGYIKPFTKTFTLGDTIKMPANYVLGQVGNVKNIMLDWAAVSKYTDELFRSKDLKEFDLLVRQRPERDGKGLTFKEKRGWEYITKLASILPSDRRKKVLLDLKDQIDAEEAVIRQFPKSEQQAIREIVQAPFAQASGLTWLKSAYKMSNKDIMLGDMKSIYLMEDVQKLSDAKEAQLKLLSLSLENMRKKLLSRTDIKDPAVVENFVNKYDAMIESERLKLSESQLKLDDNIDALLESVFLDEDKTVDPKIMDILFKGNDKLIKRANPIITDAEVQEKAATKYFKLIKQRADLIASNKQDKDFFNKSAKTLEQVFDTHILSFYARGKAGYKQLDELFKREQRSINITDLMFNFKEIADPEKAKDFKGFFSATGEFFDSIVNKKLLTALQGMAERSLEGVQGKSFDQLKEMHQNIQSKHYLGKNPDAMDIALYWYEKGDLKGFNALPSEVTELYAAFRDYAYRIDAGTGKSEMFAKYNAASNMVLKLIEDQAPDIFDAFEKANKNYKKEVFDRIDGNGILTRYMKSKSGRVQETTKSGTNVFWSNIYKGKNPQELILEFTPDIDRYLKSGKESDYLKFRDKFYEFYRQMSDFSADGNVPIFDLDDELGAAKFEAFKSALTNQIYSDWASKFLKITETISPTPRAGLLDRKTLTAGYNFAKIDRDRLNDISSLTKVMVQKNGELVEMNMLDLTKMLDDELDIVKHITRYQKAQKTYEKIRRTGMKKILNLKKNESSSLNVRNKIIEEIENISKFKRNPEGFYTQYIINGTADGIREIRKEALKKGFKREDFDNALMYYVNKGMLAAGDLKVMSGKKVPTFDGKFASLKGFNAPENLLNDLRERKEIFDEILGKDISDNMEQIVDLLVKERDAFGDVDRISGMVRGISNNEIISRAFNLARGMVSPTYVGAEIAFRLASNAGIEMLQLAGSSKEASRLMRQMLENPEKLTPAEIGRFGVLALDFVITEYARMDIIIPQFFLSEEEEEPTT